MPPNLRTTIIQNLEKNNFHKKRNVAVALILGQKQDLSPDILQDYQYAGYTYFICFRITCWIPLLF
jgi:competence protein ComEC